MTRRVLGAAVLLVAALVAACAAAPSGPVDSAGIREAVTVPGIRDHLSALQRIAEGNGGNRAFGTPGYAASVEYVRQQLVAAGYQVTTQRFQVPYFTETAQPALTTVRDGRGYALGSEIRTMVFSGSGDVTAPVSPVDLALASPTARSTSGCEDADFAGFSRGSVALLQRGTCPFADKARRAQTAGAAAALIMNEAQADGGAPVKGSLERPGVTIPVLSVSFPVGTQLAAPDHPEVRVVTKTVSESRETENVIAEGTAGRADRVVMAGAHLDSVPAGPGINDNASGVAAVLEVADHLARLGVDPRNRVRFAFWGAEELGLLGSDHYVDQLTPQQRADIAVYLNFDMVGSPNFVRLVHAPSPGEPPSKADPEKIAPPGSEVVTQVFTDYFASQGLPVEPEPLSGRSDYGPFAAAGIPVGGVHSGADQVKTPELAARYGGIPGQILDHCYHQPCDNLSNINDQALDQLGDAAAHAVLTFLLSTSTPRPAD